MVQKEKESGLFKDRRKAQNLSWFDHQFKNQLELLMHQDQEVENRRKALEKEIMEGKLNPFQAGEQLAGFVDSKWKKKK